ncbi:MAG TPA: vitamin K epoxide reductase family protein, partial [Planctomycetaceae bacterium]|nr:vitamin K epoxide reductase family protein [Planctomycetaceae bacterium]
MPASRIPSTSPASPTRLTRLSLGFFSLLGCVVAAYLLSVSLAHRNLPAGCSQGSGCDEVLNSRWAQVFGVPVSGPALAVYGVLLLTVLSMGFGSSPVQKMRKWSALILLAVVLAGSAIWFVGLQLVAVRAICPWCLAEHGLGLLVATIVLSSVPFVRKNLVAGAAEPPAFVTARRALASGGAGFV